jgi:hypothetical protein
MTYQPHQSEDVTLKCLPNGAAFDKDGNPRARYVRIAYDGSWCICKPGDVEAMVGDADESHRYITEDVYLSAQEYEALPEFEGW